MKRYQFSGKTVLITGGSRGLGKGIAEQFLNAGANVIICARKKPAMLPSTSGRSALFHSTDVRDPESTQRLIDFTLSMTERLDILINNAGGSPEIDAKNAPPRFTSAVITLNLIAPAVLSQQAYMAMADTAERGSIINIASISAARPSPGTAAYGAAKAGLVNLTQSLAQEWAPAVRVNAVIAGMAKTEAAFGHYGGAEGITKIEEHLPMKRMASADDIGKACLYLASDDAAYISGASLAVHGGGEPPAFLSLQGDP
ncbi:SDR family oxidoreductase [Microbulbifer spongiae]|uniref:SDR family oxidoreductase n=1 Tax=Microbulbifer spongiae TaxID=2944933 RepID=A0ABY9E8S5_9GAMM|nr:SDR family oxidoreductase [Microbulbifer sp. MI-G]WKD49077.1 SDR family oxidoreductase [Microbulbifer sp. MI-G]